MFLIKMAAKITTIRGKKAVDRTMDYENLFPEDFEKLDKKVIFLPLGTLEWHGAQLPFGTDMFVAHEVCKKVARKTKGAILPPLWIGTDIEEVRRGKKFQGFVTRTNCTLKGSVYYADSEIFYEVINSLATQIEKNGFRILVIISGHGSSPQLSVLRRIQDEINRDSKREIRILFPEFKNMIKLNARHADYIETSIFWHLRRDFIKKSKNTKFSNDILIRIRGDEPRKKTSAKFGRRIVASTVDEIAEEINKMKQSLIAQEPQN